MKSNLAQYTLIATVALLTACSSSSNDGNEPDTPSDAAADNSTTGDQPASNDPVNENAATPNTSAPDSAAVITMDNHIELLNFVFAIYSGQERGSEIKDANFHNTDER
ncbi:MAG: hypothetical protein V3U76_02360 [Granulosicoccus sp.]